MSFVALQSFKKSFVFILPFQNVLSVALSCLLHFICRTLSSRFLCRAFVLVALSLSRLRACCIFSVVPFLLSRSLLLSLQLMFVVVCNLLGGSVLFNLLHFLCRAFFIVLLRSLLCFSLSLSRCLYRTLALLCCRVLTLCRVLAHSTILHYTALHYADSLLCVFVFCDLCFVLYVVFCVLCFVLFVYCVLCFVVLKISHTNTHTHTHTLFCEYRYRHT